MNYVRIINCDGVVYYARIMYYLKYMNYVECEIYGFI